MIKRVQQRVTPKSKTGRLIVGLLFILGGVFGFLPILGFWMVPVGLLILSIDFPWVRRQRRKMETRLIRKYRQKFRKDTAK